MNRLVTKLLDARETIDARTIAFNARTRGDLIASERETCVEQEVTHRRRALELAESSYGRSGGSALDRVAVAFGLALAEEREWLVEMAGRLERDRARVSQTTAIQLVRSAEGYMDQALAIDELLEGTPLAAPLESVPELARQLTESSQAVEETMDTKGGERC